ncbi:MAG: hypothetical protein SGBAC_010451, partial [Bacillariaceae sp.]
MFALLYSVIMFLLLLAKQPVIMPALITARYTKASTQVFANANANTSNKTTMPPAVDFVGTAEEMGSDILRLSPSMDLLSSIHQSLNYKSIKDSVGKFEFEFDLDFKPTVRLFANGFDAIQASAERFSPTDFIYYDFDLKFLKYFQHFYEKLRSVARDWFAPPPPPPRSFDIQTIFIEAFDRIFMEFHQVYEKLQAVARNCFAPPPPPPPPRGFSIQMIDIEEFGRILLEFQQVYKKLQAVVRTFCSSPPPPPQPRSFDIRAIAVKTFKHMPCFKLEYSIRDALHKIHEAFCELPTMSITETMKQPTTVLTLIYLLFTAPVILQLLVTRAEALVAPAPVHKEIKNNEVVTLPAVATNSSTAMWATTYAIVAVEETTLDKEVDVMADLPAVAASSSAISTSTCAIAANEETTLDKEVDVMADLPAVAASSSAISTSTCAIAANEENTLDKKGDAMSDLPAVAARSSAISTSTCAIAANEENTLDKKGDA